MIPASKYYLCLNHGASTVCKASRVYNYTTALLCSVPIPATYICKHMFLKYISLYFSSLLHQFNITRFIHSNPSYLVYPIFTKPILICQQSLDLELNFSVRDINAAYALICCTYSSQMISLSKQIIYY